MFFPPGNEQAALLASLATFGAGFGVRPLGALVFGRIGDLIGRKYTFLLTVVIMGLATALTGFLPTYEQIGMWAPALLVFLRLAQGLALGGEYGGAATYVAEHAPDNQRGHYTSYIQTAATIGFFISLAVIGATRIYYGPDDFKEFGWRVPFLLSFILLGVSLYMRLQMDESPIFAKLKAEGKVIEESNQGELRQSKESEVRAARPVRCDGGPGRRVVLRAVLCAHVPAEAAESELAAVVRARRHRARDRHADVRVLRQAVGSHRPQEAHDERLLPRRDHLRADLHGHHGARESRRARAAVTSLPMSNMIGVVALITIQIVYVGLTYGPIAAFLVELFPTSIRYTSMSLPYHLGLGWFGGFLPLIATATSGSEWAKETFGSNAIYTGFIYACGVCLMTAIIGTLLIKETKDRKIDTPSLGH